MQGIHNPWSVHDNVCLLRVHGILEKSLMMTSSTLKAGTAISVLFVIIALFCRKQVDDVLKDRLNSVLEGLVKVEKQCIVDTRPKVAVGYGACNDLFIDGKELLKYDDIAESPEHFNEISSAEELLKTYAYFFRHGAAAE
jgi:ADP-dependent glucokinase